MTIVFSRPESMLDVPTHYCPGCLHGVAHRLVAEVLDELALDQIAIGVAPVGCASMAFRYIDTDWASAAHGRAPAVATGLKRVHPDKVVFTYQGDGDLASIGTAEIVHAAMRNERITVIFINNGIYGMTGGQMAPTTQIGQKTTTSPFGRDPSHSGYPIKMSEVLAQMEGDNYIARSTLHNPAGIVRAKRFIKKAFQHQLDKRGFALVELISNCPNNWGMTPTESIAYINEHQIKYYQLGELKG
jgi:2-oxoglutarate ferredoxin oxidoreductase subunit beta